MFNIGDRVLNQKTGQLGKVIGYGHQILNNAYMPTLKVLMAEAADFSKLRLVEEDLYSVWMLWQNS